jgi:hypothetical protein
VGAVEQAPGPGVKSLGARGEAALGVAMLALGVVPRALVAWLLPTQPISDFAEIIRLAQAILSGDRGELTIGWSFFNPGLPYTLALLFRLHGTTPAVTARWATAMATGTLGLLAFALLRGVVPLRARVAAGALLALWPGQVMTAGIVSQDNWVLLPTVALACLAVRGGARREAHPVAAACLLVAGVAVRQEMLLVLLPLAIAATALGERPARRALVAAAVAATGLLGIAAWRHAATGRFGLTSEHTGIAVLGSFVPGATRGAWTDPMPEFAALAPQLLEDPAAARRGAAALVWAEARRRPLFHAARIVANTAVLAVDGEVSVLYWATCEPCLPTNLRARAETVLSMRHALRLELLLVHSLFLVVTWLALRRRDLLGCLLAATVALKIGLHAVTVLQGRYLLAATAVELIAIVVLPAIWKLPWRRLVRPTLVGLAVVLGARLAGGRLLQAVENQDVFPRRTYTFPLIGLHGVPRLRCTLLSGALVAWDPSGAAFRLRHDAPLALERAQMECTRAPSPAVPAASQAPLGSSLLLTDALGSPWLGNAVRWRVAAGDTTLAENNFGDPGLVAGEAVPLPPSVLAGTLPLHVEMEVGIVEPEIHAGAAAVLRVALR